MERNSRDFARRTRIIDQNTETVCDYLRARSVEVGAKGAVIEKVFYPKYTTSVNYEMCRVKDRDGADGTNGAGYGGLFALDFISMDASKAFYDNLEVLKGSYHSIGLPRCGMLTFYPLRAFLRHEFHSSLSVHHPCSLL